MAFIAVPVATWVGGALATAGASAAVATTVGAIAGSVAIGVVSGAVIGAATAVVTGGDILDGALKGALIGGVTAGVFSGLGAAFSSVGTATGTSTATSVGTNASTTAALQGPNAALFSTTASPATVAASNAAKVATGGAVSTATPGYSSGSLATPDVINQVGQNSGVGQTVPKRSLMDKILFDSEGTLNAETGKIIAGVGAGAAEALLTPEPESNLEYLRQQQAYQNSSGEFEKSTANIKIPDSWQKYNKLSQANLSQAVAPKGVAYASPAA